MKAEPTGIVFNIQHYSIHDGPGIRTVVFLKGCPLACRWCCNPESMDRNPELGFRQTLCNGCSECLPVCPQQALTLNEEATTLIIDRQLCTNCGTCVTACVRGALTIYGKRMTVAEVVDDVVKDAPFYRRSGGGVTISGGEPCMHPAFLMGILRGCREAGIHTAIETSGYVNDRLFSRLLEELDLVLFDLKLMDPDEHYAATGKRNERILSNARSLAGSGRTVRFRMPLIPGVNDGADNLKQLADFLTSVGLPSIELMPYHQFGRGKYAATGRVYAMGDEPSATPEVVESVCRILSDYGIECGVSS
jgi:pyruvate formate lyase activating enzyme